MSKHVHPQTPTTQGKHCVYIKTSQRRSKHRRVPMRCMQSGVHAHSKPRLMLRAGEMQSPWLRAPCEGNVDLPVRQAGQPLGDGVRRLVQRRRHPLDTRGAAVARHWVPPPVCVREHLRFSGEFEAVDSCLVIRCRICCAAEDETKGRVKVGYRDDVQNAPLVCSKAVGAGIFAALVRAGEFACEALILSS